MPKLPSKPKLPKDPSPGEEAFKVAIRCFAPGLLPLMHAQYRFWPERRFTFDFVFLPAKIAVEVEGGTWGGRPCVTCGVRGGGRHNRASGYARDTEKYNGALLLGYRVLRYTTEQVESDPKKIVHEVVQMVNR